MDAQERFMQGAIRWTFFLDLPILGIFVDHYVSSAS